MAQSIACPNCRAKLFAPPDVYGQPVRCTNCKSSFTASVIHSPYLDDAPAAPKDRRTLIMAGGVAATLAIALAAVWAYNASNVELRPSEGPPASGEQEKAVDRVREESRREQAEIYEKAMALRIRSEEEAKRAEAKKNTDEVTISQVRWYHAEGVRQLHIAYAFHPPASPVSGRYTLKVRFGGKDAGSLPIPVTQDEDGILQLPIDAFLSVPPAQLPKAAVWFERSTGINSIKVSNEAATP